MTSRDAASPAKRIDETGDAPAAAPAATPAAPSEPLHELRVRVPTDVHRQLLALKILRGVTLAESIVLALDRYFAERPVPTVPELAKPGKRP